MQILLGRASIIQCFFHAWHDMCVHKAWSLKCDTTEMTAATIEDYIGWLLENSDNCFS